MKKAKSNDLRPEYRREDLAKGVRGKYLKAYRAGTNLVLLRPEVAKAFPTFLGLPGRSFPLESLKDGHNDQKEPAAKNQRRPEGVWGDALHSRDSNPHRRHP